MYMFRLATTILAPCFFTLCAWAHEDITSLAGFFQPAETSLTEPPYINPAIASLRYIADTVTTASKIVTLEPALREFQRRLDKELMTFHPELSDARPDHVAIIMDGNRRWARASGYEDSAYGHCFGAARLRQIVEAAERLQITQLTVYAFSEKNWHRTKHEVGVLMSMVKSVLEYWQPELSKLRVRVRHLGSEAGLDEKVINSIRNIVATTKENTGLTLNIVFNYGERQEAAEACRAACMKTEAPLITAALFSQHLYTGQLEGWTDPDLMIRTSGEMRISGFLPLQTSYSEMFFSNSFWPDFTPGEFNDAIKVYSQRKRRFGQ